MRLHPPQGVRTRPGSIPSCWNASVVVTGPVITTASDALGMTSPTDAVAVAVQSGDVIMAGEPMAEVRVVPVWTVRVVPVWTVRVERKPLAAVAGSAEGRVVPRSSNA